VTEKTIQKALYEKFISHRYKFANVFYFENESDFLTFLPSGFCYEFEIKISRSDFKADFKKVKHVIHKNNGKKYYTVKGREIYNQCPDWDFCKHFPELIICEDYTDRYAYSMIRRELVRLRCTAFSSVEFREFKNEKLPNKFFYVVPEGLIAINEVPEYAGLIYVNDKGETKKVKDGKFIHKQILSPAKLWNKTYHAYENQLHSKLFTK